VSLVSLDEYSEPINNPKLPNNKTEAAIEIISFLNLLNDDILDFFD